MKILNFLIIVLFFCILFSCKKEISREEHQISEEVIIGSELNASGVQSYLTNHSKLKSGGNKGRAKIDFDGDGQSDIATIWRDGSSWSIDVYLSGLTKRRWATQDGGWFTGQTIVYGDFNGDGKTDIARFFTDRDDWSVDVHKSTGSSFVRERWASRQGRVYPVINWFVADFNGDGKDDFCNFWKESNNLISADVHLSTGSSFVKYRWLTFGGRWMDYMRLMIGDFNGDGRPDVVTQFIDGNSWSFDVYHNTGSSFVKRRWGTQLAGIPNIEYRLVGDFNGDGKDDLARFFDDGSFSLLNFFGVDVHLSTGYSFGKERWISETGFPNPSPIIFVCDVNNDLKDDIVGYDSYSDPYHIVPISILQSNSNSFTLKTVPLNQNLHYYLLSPGDFNGDGNVEFSGLYGASPMYFDIISTTGQMVGHSVGGNKLQDMQFIPFIWRRSNNSN